MGKAAIASACGVFRRSCERRSRMKGFRAHSGTAIRSAALSLCCIGGKRCLCNLAIDAGMRLFVHSPSQSTWAKSSEQSGGAGNRPLRPGRPDRPDRVTGAIGPQRPAGPKGAIWVPFRHNLKALERTNPLERFRNRCRPKEHARLAFSLRKDQHGFRLNVHSNCENPLVDRRSSATPSTSPGRPTAAITSYSSAPSNDLTAMPRKTGSFWRP